MGFTYVATATGRGTLDLGGLQTVSEVATHVVTLASMASVAGASPVRRIHHQAFWALGLTPGGGPLTGIPVFTAWGYIQLETESHPFPNVDLRLGDTLYFDVYDGGVMYFEVDWP